MTTTTTTTTVTTNIVTAAAAAAAAATAAETDSDTFVGPSSCVGRHGRVGALSNRYHHVHRRAAVREKLRIQAERQETRLMEALQSPKWDTKLVAEHNLAWLVSKGEVDERVQGVKEAVGNVLHRMVLDGEFTSRLCRMLDLWKAWAENGGMRKSDLAALQEDQVTFAYATLLVAIIKDTSTALEGTVSMDLQECLRLWRTVRLG